MHFNSYEFILFFLPVALLGYLAARRCNDRTADFWLFVVSLFFYGWWNWTYVPLLAISICFNFFVGTQLQKKSQCGTGNKLLIFGVTANLALLVYFKYFNFFLTTVNSALTTHWTFSNIILPLGISFFTFTQIAFLVDAFRGEIRDKDFIRYGLFVTYFPHLIAGPVLHHREIIPQFGSTGISIPLYRGLALGLSMFAMGLFKKVVIADQLAQYVTPVFDPTLLVKPTFFEAWCGTFAYTFQLYFDFSGYSDMAIGLSLMFGIRLPLNFYSPYKATNIIEFWRRWHMTLSRFLRNYLYVPLGGNRKGPMRRYINLSITMILGGLWHGAGWTFLAWGALHAFYLIINHCWQEFRRAMGWFNANDGAAAHALSVFITFIAVAVAWVFFRAESLTSALSILKGMVGLNGVVLMEQWLPKLGAFGDYLIAIGVEFGHPFYYTNFPEAKFVLIATFLIAWCLPNTHEIMAKYETALVHSALKQTTPQTWCSWSPNLRWAILGGLVFAISLAKFNKLSEFLYFQF